MKVSVIIAVYKDVEALNLIIQSLKHQTYTNFEVIIAEDGNSIKMKEYISTIKDLEVKHTTQEDLNVRKAKSQNNALIASSGKYLIFIDGDCIPYSNFIYSHVTLAQKGVVLSGRRINLTRKLTERVKNSKLSTFDIEKNILKYFYLLNFRTLN